MDADAVVKSDRADGSRRPRGRTNRWLTSGGGGGQGLAVAVLAACLLLGGCATTSPTGDKVAATVTVEGASLEQIRTAAFDVFQQQAFLIRTAHGRDLVFERQGSKLAGLAYGSWMNHNVWMRLRLRIEEIKPGTNVVSLKTFRVEDHGDPVLEEEREVSGSNKRICRDLLAQVVAKVKAQPAVKD